MPLKRQPAAKLEYSSKLTYRAQSKGVGKREMDERSQLQEEGAVASSSQHRVSHKDLRDLLRDFEAMREVKLVEGADPHLEISALAETLTMRFPGEEPALLFDKIKGFKPGYRILSGASNSFRRLAHVYGLPTPEKKMVVVTGKPSARSKRI